MTATTATEARPFDWFRTLGKRGRRAFVGAFGGDGLDSFDYQTLPLGLAAITAYFGISSGEAGLLGTTTLVVSALGGGRGRQAAGPVGPGPAPPDTPPVVTNLPPPFRVP